MGWSCEQIKVHVEFNFILTWRGRGSCSPKRVINKARRLIEYTALHAAVCGRLWLQLRLYVRRRIFARVGLCACRRPRTYPNKRNCTSRFSVFLVHHVFLVFLWTIICCSSSWVLHKNTSVTTIPYLLGLLAKIKCSICSYQLNLWYGGHWPPSRLNLFLYRVGDHMIYHAPTQVTSVLHTSAECCW